MSLTTLYLLKKMGAVAGHDWETVELDLSRTELVLDTEVPVAEKEEQDEELVVDAGKLLGKELWVGY